MENVSLLTDGLAKGAYRVKLKNYCQTENADKLCKFEEFK